MFDGAKLLSFNKAVPLVEPKFSLLIPAQLLVSGGSGNFNKLLSSINGLTPKTLSTRLKELEEKGLVSKQILVGRPIRIEYRLTKKGLALEKALAELADWWTAGSA